MTTLFDIYGFVSVVANGLALVVQTLLLGSVSFALFVAAPLSADHMDEPIAADLRRVLQVGALASVVAVAASTALSAIVLAVSLGASWREVAGARFAIAAQIKVLAAVWIGLVASFQPVLAVRSRIAIGVAALVFLCASVSTSHSIARTDESALLTFATGLHELGAALWLGGLPCLWLALHRVRRPLLATRIGVRYSALAITGVAMIIGSAAVFSILYIGSLDAVYGTAYGAMVITKSVLFGILLLLGLLNFRAVRCFAVDTGAVERVRHFVEVEMGIGFAVLMAAASITSLPPAVDLVDDRLAWSDIATRMAPVAPRLVSPGHNSLALPALQARLDTEAQVARSEARPLALVPGSDEAPPRNAYDIAWSEYNHHWAGLFLIAMGFAALTRRSGRVPWAKNWPLLFLLLAVFLFLRADPEVWPMGSVGLLESLKDPEVAQHRIFEVLIVAFALFEWGVSTGRVLSRRLARVFPLLMATAGTLLLTHSHALANVKEELLVDLTHLPIAVLGIVAGLARWLEVETPRAAGRWAGWVWPTCFVAIGLLLLGYREA